MPMNIEKYSEQFKIQLGEQMLKRHRIYLDTKYWIHMRDASLGTASPIHIKIHDKLKLLSQDNTVICPLSYHLIQELMNIGDKQKRLQTAKVMDELSRQVTFIPPLEIPGQELICFIRNSLNKTKGKPIFNPTKYVWTKVFFLNGEFHRFSKNFSKADNERMQVDFFKYCAKFTLVEILKKTKEFKVYDGSSFIERLNKDKDKNLDFKTFDDVFLQEITGMLDLSQNDIREVFSFLYPSTFGKKPTQEEQEKSELWKKMQNLIYHAFRLKKIGKKLPYIHTYAAIYAFIRYNKEQRFKKNDLADISHASLGLPYCNAFFTERRLSAWISNSPLNLVNTYGTSVLHQDKDILDYLNRLTGEK